MVSEDAKNNDGEDIEPATAVEHGNLLTQIDELIERVNSVRGVFLGMSFAAIILAPLSILLSAYLILHPSFYKLIDSEDGFGYVLSIFLGIVISVSFTWLITGLRQHQALKSWNKRHQSYLTEKNRIEQVIAAQYGFADDGNQG
jgi:hypothetical protein